MAVMSMSEMFIIEVVNDKDTCQECATKANKTYASNDAVVDDMPDCTSDVGCRCLIQPLDKKEVVDGPDVATSKADQLQPTDDIKGWGRLALDDRGIDDTVYVNELAETMMNAAVPLFDYPDDKIAKDDTSFLKNVDAEFIDQIPEVGLPPWLVPITGALVLLALGLLYWYARGLL